MSDIQQFAQANEGGITLLAEALHGYLYEIERDADLCAKHNCMAAIHTRGQSFQLYRLFSRDEETAKQIFVASTRDLPPWEESIYYIRGGKSHELWRKMQSQIEHRMKRSKHLHALVTRGVAWEGLPVLIHAYKFEPDPVMKVELVLGYRENPAPELPLKVIAALLRCHEFIVPEHIAQPLPPYQRHETQFETIAEHLSHTMQKELYATRCLQRVSCHASNGVGSRDTPCEHPGALASHSKYAHLSKP